MIFALAGVVIAIILIAIYANPAARHCRWREDRRRGDARAHGAERHYVCVACGAQTATTTGKPPYDCRRPGTDRAR